MSKNRVEKSPQYENSDVDDDDDKYEQTNNVKSCKIKKNHNKPKEIYDDDDSDDYYEKEILNHRKSKEKEIDFENADSDIENEDKLSYIVHAVLEELRNDKSDNKSQKKEEHESTVKFAKEIDKYLSSDHIKRNKYLISHTEFQRKLRKLMKSIYNLDSRDESIPKFTQTEKTLMKVFFKEKQEQHDRRFMMVENNIFLNMLRKI